MRTAATLALWIVSASLHGQIACSCDPQQPETLKQRPCSLCEQSEKQPAAAIVFFLQDSSPRKPNRWLAIPREHSPGMNAMSALPADVRAELWRNAIAKGKELWGDRWGVAYNAERLHTQCHVHIHIGRLIEGVEWGTFTVVNGSEEIPQPGKDGLWVHPVDGKLHVHTGEQVTENVLLR
jgi:diadenosine tetraphosphate (Ap4A) HIT family hydrolase